MLEIVKKITDLFMKYGIKSVTMDDVARELGISKKTLYQHFKDKDEVVSKVLEYEKKIQRGALCKLCNSKSNAIDELLIVSKYLSEKFQKISPSFSYDLQKYYPSKCKKLIEERNNHVFKQIKQNMLNGIEQGLYLNNLNLDIISSFYIFRLDNRVADYYTASGFGFNEVFQTLIIYHIRGIANKKGIEYLEKKIKENKIINT